ncbi:MAG: hypothetical protein AB1679_18705 [Actinomycetota bacterium]
MIRFPDRPQRSRLLALMLAVPVIVGMGTPAAAAVPGVDRPSAFGAPCDVPVVSVACDAVGGVVDHVAAVPGSMADGVIQGFASWVASGAARLVDAAGEAISENTTVSLTGDKARPWFLDHYRRMASLAGLVLAPMLLLAALHAALTASGALLWRALVNLPVATLGTAAAVTVTQLLLGITDWASAELAATIPGDTRSALLTVSHALIAAPMPDPAGRAAVGAFGVALLGLFMAIVALVVWLELVVREAAIYLTVVFLPLGFATFVWPALSPWLRRLFEIIVALVLSKLVIVAALALAGGALATQEGFGTLVAGAGMLLLAAFAPFALFKLVPIASLASISSLEGLGRRAPRAVAARLPSVGQARHLAAVSALPAAVGSTRQLPGGAAASGGGRLPPPPPPPTGPAHLPSFGRPGGGGGVPPTTGGGASVAGATGGAALGLAEQARRRLDTPLPFPDGDERR